LRDLLAHLYVLVPVLDDDKHYWVGDDEVEKLLRHGEGWLAAHPARELIALRYLKHRRSLTRDALERLSADEGADDDAATESHAREEEAIEERVRLDDLRRDAVAAAVKECGARSVLDLGCGEGKLVKALLRDKSLTRVVGVDVSHRALDIAAERLDLERISESRRARVELLHGSLFYRDARFAGFDAAAVVEVIEHLDPPRLEAFRRVVFEYASPPTVIVTTPNVEYNAKLDGLAVGRFRHKDHRFEWTRAEFEAWARETAATSSTAGRASPTSCGSSCTWSARARPTASPAITR
jgi:3' terminal RNA ribose 2'-O-methyltransferase Hen1